MSGSGERTRGEVQAVEVLRFDGSATTRTDDRVAHEEPLEIEIGDTTIAVVMRTPEHDLELVTGFLLTERIVASLDDVVSVHHASDEGGENRVRTTLRDGVPLDLSELRRNLFANSSCGVCGKASREKAMETAPPLAPTGGEVAAEALLSLPEQLRSAQKVFDETGGLHAAGLFAPEGRLLVSREDVGRHNAVDKVIGWAARSGRFPLTDAVLIVSGRASFEIVQKALAARIPVVAAVSAPSSLAVGLARDAGITLVGFLRGSSFNAYSHPERLTG